MAVYAHVRQQAQRNGYQIDTVRAWLGRDLYWLTSGWNWASTEPGRTLDEIKDYLDSLEQE